VYIVHGKDIMKPLTITTDRFEADVLDSDIPVLIDFWAPWCGPCRAITSALEQIASEYAGRLTVAKVNIDEEPSIASAFGVQSIPTLVVLHGRKVTAAAMGAMPKAELIDALGLASLPTPAGA
jgi:thioredoxin 1